MSNQRPAFLLTIESLEVAYGAVQVIRGISAAAKPHQVVSIIGSNGAGKTTTLKALAGLLKTKSGRILFEGDDITHTRSHERVKRGIVMSPEGRELWPRMSVEETLLMGAFPVDLRQRSGGNLSKVYEMFPRLKDRRRQMAGTLSGGEQQMCAIGRALMAEPRLLMLDEPSLGLAPILVEEIFNFIGRIAEEGITVLLVEQNMNYAFEACDYAYVLETGKIVMEGAGEELMENDHVKTAYFGKCESTEG